MYLPDLTMEMTFRLLISSILGGLIGLEREVHGRPAGFRTHLLVSLGSCLFVLSSVYVHRLYGNLGGVGTVGVDPGRIAAQVVTGIGFLGAGAIIREKAAVRGLTTAACLWVAAAIGLACGVGMYVTAVLVTVLSLGSLLLLKRVEKVISRDSYTTVKIWSSDVPGQREVMESKLVECGLKVVGFSTEKDLESRQIIMEFEVRYRTRSHAASLVDSIAEAPGVRRIRVN